jgi:hypothetical protein
MTVEGSDTGTKTIQMGLRQIGGRLGGLMTTADAYRRYAAECLSMSHRHENKDQKALLMEMAMKWLRLAEFAERNQATDDEPSAI